MSVRTLEESFANFLAINTKVSTPEPEPTECPICMEVIVTTKNIVVTECGHTFHCSCLMTNVAHNGFECPYCRTEMAKEVDNESSEYEGDGSITDSVNAAIHEDDMLRGFRMFYNLSDGIEHEHDDIEEEKFYQAYLEQNASVAAEHRESDDEFNNVANDIANASAERDAATELQLAAESDALLNTTIVNNHDDDYHDYNFDNILFEDDDLVVQ